ncbi:hypothetical protein [Amycolatopsis sp. lyj-84]|uniref:hypothetical protein n=1 Tax=Amycolatopsis sp. lyj-84 TaxID=2789284 RepID=UPI00397D48B7
MVRTVKARRVMAAVLAMGAVIALTAGPANAAAEGSWRADLSTVDGDDVNVRSDGGVLSLENAAWHRKPDSIGSQGYLLLAERNLGKPVNRVTAQVTAEAPNGTEVEVDVRGKLNANDWTEWTPTEGGAAQLSASVSTVQVRVGLRTVNDGVTAKVSDITLQGELGPQVNAIGAAAAPLTYKVFGTREGLVGGTTANGHVIKSRDHFVALPSGRGLAPKNTGNYTVRICRTDNSRCEYAPVWDVGPWNTKDDYWNPSATRQMWKNLPQGKPEAQAAYQDGYNGGKDEFGRKVANPAGIDLADGTFWDGLKMTDNGWVNVSYLWTGSGPTGVISTAGDPMNVRASASTTAAIKGLAANYAKVNIECYVEGETVTGKFGTSNIWDRIGPGHYVSDTYLKTGSDLPVAPKC